MADDELEEGDVVEVPEAEEDELLGLGDEDEEEEDDDELDPKKLDSLGFGVEEDEF
jgi:hypothetical protein